MEEAGVGRRREVFSANLFAFAHLLPESVCAPLIGSHKMNCSSFRPGGGEQKN